MQQERDSELQPEAGPPAWRRNAAAISREQEYWMGAGLFLVALVVYALINHGRYAHLNYFLPLAVAFLNGHLGVADNPSWLNELIPYQGHYYVVYPPMPAVLLMPFVLILGPTLNQANVSIMVGAANVFLFSRVLFNLGYRGWRRLLFSLLFAFGTISWFSVQYGNAWHFAHVCAIFFLLLAMLADQVGRSPWLVGLLLGCAALSRLPTGMAFPYFVAHYVQLSLHAEERESGGAEGVKGLLARLDRGCLTRLCLQFASGAAVPLLLYFLYNYLRFGDPLQMGYSLIPGVTHEWQYRFGILSFNNVGKNLYAMLLKAPNGLDTFPFIQPWHLGGPNILFITPVFLWAIKARARDWFTIGSWAAIFCISIPILTHGGQGEYQFGYRFSQDFLPFLLPLALRGLGTQISLEGWLAIGLSFLVNLWGMIATAIDWWTTIRVC